MLKQRTKPLGFSSLLFLSLCISLYLYKKSEEPSQPLSEFARKTAFNTPNDYPPVLLPKLKQTGHNIGRTLHLLASSTPQRRNTVRILFYGQSITKQDWWRTVVNNLRKRFPYANIVAKNLAIGGFGAHLLVKTSDYDLYSFYPDLLIFHVYGSLVDYEKIIRRTKKYTTAEIAIWNDHYELEQDPGAIDEAWLKHRNTSFFARIAEKYNLEYIEIRQNWQKYLLGHDLYPQVLLADDIHLNDHGTWLMGQLISHHILSLDIKKPIVHYSGNVKNYNLVRDAQFKGGKLTLDFCGNRIVAIANQSDSPSTAKILIDGKPTSSHKGTYVFTRPLSNNKSDWPWGAGVPLRIGSQTQLQPENWTLEVTKVQNTKFYFTLKGSQTGFDGHGNNKERFVSNSGRVVIEADDWFLEPAASEDNSSFPVKIGHLITFKSKLLGLDNYKAPHIDDPTILPEILLAQGLENKKHRLEIIIGKEGALPITAVRTYEPSSNSRSFVLNTQFKH